MWNGDRSTFFFENGKLSQTYPSSITSPLCAGPQMGVPQTAARRSWPAEGASLTHVGSSST